MKEGHLKVASSLMKTYFGWPSQGVGRPLEMAIDDPITLLAIPALVLLIAYQIYGRGKGKKRNGLYSLGLAVVTLGIIVLILFDFVTAFLFLSAGILLIMVGEIVSRITS